MKYLRTVTVVHIPLVCVCERDRKRFLDWGVQVLGKLYSKTELITIRKMSEII